MLILLILIIACLLIYFLFWPVPVKPISWKAPAAPAAEGDFAVNERLREAHPLPIGGVGPEDVIFDQQGRLYGGLEDGRIMRMRPDGSDLEKFTETGGRPLGLAFDADGNLIIADADKGLLSASPEGELTVLVNRIDGRELVFPNHLDVAADGTIYFSESSDRFPYQNYVPDVIESRANGRLMAYDPQNAETKVVREDLFFANGVAINDDQSFLLNCELTRYRIRRIWLSGPRAGEDEIFIENLPGFPDNLHYNGRDTFWLAFSSTRLSIADKLSRFPFLRKIIYRVPDAVKPKPVRHGYVIGLDKDGNVVHNFQDPSGEYGETSCAVEHNGELFVGSLTQDYVVKLPLR